MKKLWKKLRSTGGESLVEAMASVLIFTFASIILLSMISTAADINRTAKAADADLREELYVAEEQDRDKSHAGRITVSVQGSTQSQSIPVEFYYGNAGKLYTFAAKK